MGKRVEFDVPIALRGDAVIVGLMPHWVGNPTSWATDPVVSVLGRTTPARGSLVAQPVAPCFGARTSGRNFSLLSSAVSDSDQLRNLPMVTGRDSDSNGKEPGMSARVRLRSANAGA